MQASQGDFISKKRRRMKDEKVGDWSMLVTRARRLHRTSDLPSEAVYVTRGTLTMMVLAGKAATGLSPVSKWD